MLTTSSSQLVFARKPVTCRRPAAGYAASDGMVEHTWGFEAVRVALSVADSFQDFVLREYCGSEESGWMGGRASAPAHG
uniref:Uncharacterized protein n=1 Tax=Oryza nivara TaxID=4536 RepID=A0A0E0IJW8_ORYNI